MKPTKEEILKYFFYCKLTGNLLWRYHWAGNKQYLIGQIAGSVHKDHNVYYRTVKFEYKSYTVHRVVYFLETGEWPETIDHIDGNGLNNKFSNLRAVTTRENAQNLYLHRNGRLMGSTFDKKAQRWRSQITINYKNIRLGHFDSELEAHQAYINELKVRGLL